MCFYVKNQGTLLENISATVTSPSGVNQQGVVLSDGPGIYHVSFMPLETGEHIIDVSYKRAPVPGIWSLISIGSYYEQASIAYRQMQFELVCLR